MISQKICPIRWVKTEGVVARCITKSCAFWVNGECAIVKIAKFVSDDLDDG